MSLNEKKCFAVVYLPLENIYSEIPTNWLTEDQKSCWWPNTLNVTSYMTRGDLPDANTWNLHTCEVEMYCSTLEKARKKAECPDYTSTNDECRIKGRGKRVKKLAKFDHFDDIATSDEDFMSPPPPLPPRSPPKPTMHSEQQAEVSKNHYECATVSSQANNGSSEVVIVDNTANRILDNIDNIPIQIIQDPLQNKTVQDLFNGIERIAQMCLKTQKYVQELEKSIKGLTLPDREKGNILNESKLKEIEEYFPLKTTEDIDNFEDYFIKGKEAVEQLCATYFKRIGGKDMKDHINRILGQLFSNELGTKLSWFGLRGNQNMSRYKFMKHLVEVITDKYSSNCAAVEKQLNEWFRLSKQRLGRVNKNKKDEESESPR